MPSGVLIQVFFPTAAARAKSRAASLDLRGARGDEEKRPFVSINSSGRIGCRNSRCDAGQAERRSTSPSGAGSPRDTNRPDPPPRATHRKATGRKAEPGQYSGPDRGRAQKMRKRSLAPRGGCMFPARPSGPCRGRNRACNRMRVSRPRDGRDRNTARPRPRVAGARVPRSAPRSCPLGAGGRARSEKSAHSAGGRQPVPVPSAKNESCETWGLSQ